MPKRPTPGLTITAESREARKEWADKNPLRAWRLSQTPKVTILEAAGELGVGMSMVQMYEKGVHRPGTDKEPEFARVLGSDWSDRWDAWLSARP